MAAMQKAVVGSSAASSSCRQSSVVPCHRASSSRSQRHVARIAQPAAAPAPLDAAAAAPVDPFPSGGGGASREYKPLTPQDLSSHPVDAESMKLPAGYHWYETMIVVRPTVLDQERDELLAKFEAYLNKEECLHINALVRPRSRMAYPMKKLWDGMYVLYTYAARRQTARAVQLHLSNPEAGREDDILRHITFCKM